MRETDRTLFEEAFDEQFLAALLGGSPEGMLSRLEEQYGIDPELVSTAFDKEFHKAVHWVGSNEGLHTQILEQCGDDLEQQMAAVTWTLAQLMSYRFFFAGAFIEKKVIENASTSSSN